MAAPVVANIGTGANASGASVAVPFPTLSAGDLLLLQVIIHDGNAVAHTVDNSFTALSTRDFGNGNGQAGVWYKKASGSESGNITVTCTGNTQVMAGRCYGVTGWNDTGTLSDAYESLDESATTLTSSNTIADVGITTSDVDRLALNFVFVWDNNALDAFTGMTGGTWAEATADYQIDSGQDAALGLQSATMASAGTINGGTDVMAASDDWYVIGFAIKPGASGTSVTVSGAAATAPAEALAATITAVRIVSIAGEAAAAPSAALTGSVQIARTVSGEAATSPAAALEGAVTAIRIVSIAGEVATAPAAALTAAIQVARTVSGEVAEATAEALAATVTAVRNASISGEVAEAPAESLAASIQTGLIKASNLDSVADATDGLTITSNSVSPTGNNLILVAIAAVNRDADADPGTPTVVGNGITYDLVGSNLYSSRGRIYVFRGLSSSPSAGTIVATWAGNVRGLMIVDQFSGVDTGGTNGSAAIVQSANTGSAGVTSLSVTLSSFADVVNNVAYGAFVHNTAEATAEGSGFVELDDEFSAGAMGLQTEYRIGQDTSVDASWATSSPAGGVAAELRALVSVTISGSIATAPAAALDGTVLQGRVVAGEVASADAAALDATISTVQTASVSGVLAEAEAAALAASVVATRIVSIAGQMATAEAAAAAAVIQALVTTSIAGEIAEAEAEALAGVWSEYFFPHVRGMLAAYKGGSGSGVTFRQASGSVRQIEPVRRRTVQGRTR